MQNACEKCGLDAAPPRRFVLSTVTQYSVPLDKTYSGFILPTFTSLRSRNPPAACLVVALLREPQFQIPSIDQCRDYAIRHDCEPNGRSLGQGTAQEAENSLVKGKEKRASRHQVLAAGSTRRLSDSPRQREPSTTSAPPTAQSHSHSPCPFWPISPRHVLPFSRLPLRQSYPTRLSSSRRSTNFPPSNLPTYKPPSLILLRTILCKLPSTTSAASSFSDPSTSTVLPTATSFLRSAIFPARNIRSIRRCLTSFYPQNCPSVKISPGA
jgi:hypothetical protein